MAVGQKKGNSTLLFAGVNSSPADIAGGKNKHFRVFTVEGATKGAKNAIQKVTETSRKTIFTGVEKDLYQRVTRLSKPYAGQSQIGAVTTGLANQSEVIMFDAAGTSPRIIGGWQSNKEAVDCDFIQTAKEEYLFAYCDEHDIWMTKVSQNTVADAEPTCVYVTPASNQSDRPRVPSIKGLRWLTKDYLLVLSNIHGGNGVILQILRLPPAGKTGQAGVLKSVRLPSSVTKSTGFAVANLTPPTTPAEPQGFTQFVVAVAGHDISISLFKIDIQVSGLATLVTSIKPFKTFKKDHPIQITSLALSSFLPPTQPITGQTPQQFLRLASTSMSNTVVVHTIPLFPVPFSVQRGQSKTPRYVVALPSRNFNLGIVFAVIAVLLGTVVMDALLDIRGGPPARLGTTKYIPINWQHKLGKPYEFPPGYSASLNAPAPTSAFSTEFEDVPTTVVEVPAQQADDAQLTLPELLAKAQAQGVDGVVIIKDAPGADGVQAQLHDEEVHGPAHKATKWEDLPAKQKEGWKKKLSEAGHWSKDWAEETGEAIFKGVLFSELAGAIGHAVAGA